MPGVVSAAARRGLLPLVAVSVAACGALGPAEHSGPNTALVDSAFAEAARQANLTSLVVFRDGTLERQLYLNGGGADTAQDVRSVTKSVVSLLVGIAADRGCLPSLDQTLADLLGPLAPADSAKRAITLRQLLNMTSGLGGDELANVDLYNQWALAPDQLTYVWDLPLVSAPGSSFNYYSPNFYIASRILTEACGQETAAFAREVLFAPLGIGPRAWETDDKGYANGGAGLQLTPMDMVAIGALVMDSGHAGGVEVVPSGWVRSATTPTVATTAVANVTGYGYGWWIGRAGGAGYVMAMGWGGQFIVVVPSKRLIVTATARWQGVDRGTASAQWLAIDNIILQRIVPAY
jgi:CubicO group peptidase (beta-lactamase class C family)